jgi:type I restriction enzyme M protein
MLNAKQSNIKNIVDIAINTLEKSNATLNNTFVENYYSNLQIENKNISSLLDTINNIQMDEDSAVDIIGKVYEYFLNKFAIAEGTGKGEFYTPKPIVNLICELLQPYKGKIYDPACGSGGMFVQSYKFIESHSGNSKADVSVYGQEREPRTYKLCKQNLAMRGIECNLGELPVSTFTNDQHKNLKVDFIMANPPFNLKN